MMFRQALSNFWVLIPSILLLLLGGTSATVSRLYSSAQSYVLTLRDLYRFRSFKIRRVDFSELHKLRRSADYKALKL